MVNDRIEIINELRTINDIIRNIHFRKTDNEKYLLYICQTWLNRCHWYGDEIFLELPGQYTGEHKPIIENHVKIMKFGDKITVFQSLRKPVKITVHGSNGKTYDFLCKYGEDLRLDQRIQQLLEMMSHQLKSDYMCRLANLSIHTYTVVPINCYCGILQWVDETIAMQQIINQCMERHDRNAYEKVAHLSKKYMTFLKAVFPKAQQQQNAKSDLPHIYGNAALQYAPYKIANNFKAITNEVPIDCVRYVLIDMSVSPESYFMLRNNFASSLSAMNIGHWLLGIGDRHLSNILLNTINGKLIGIDFGVAFGGGTLNFPIPELLPFRLTPRFVDALNPLGISGLIMKNMCHSLRTFRQNRKLLMACMEVFIREPTIDWLDFLDRKNDENNESIVSSSSHGTWKPTERIEIVEKKLAGANPKWCFETEINYGIINK